MLDHKYYLEMCAGAMKYARTDKAKFFDSHEADYVRLMAENALKSAKFRASFVIEDGMTELGALQKTIEVCESYAKNKARDAIDRRVWRTLSIHLKKEL